MITIPIWLLILLIGLAALRLLECAKSTTVYARTARIRLWVMPPYLRLHVAFQVVTALVPRHPPFTGSLAHLYEYNWKCFHSLTLAYLALYAGFRV